MRQQQGTHPTDQFYSSYWLRLGAEWITIRSSANDAIMGYPTWSKLYAGRTTLHSGLTDIANGVPVEQVHESFKKGLTEGDETRMFTFA